MTHEQTNATIFALAEESEDYEDEDEFYEDEINYEDSYLEIWSDNVDIGIGRECLRYEGNDKSFVRLEELFNPDGTLAKTHEALYVESDYDSSIMRIEADGSWMIVGDQGPFDNYVEPARRGRIEQKDVTNPLLGWREEEVGKAIFFDRGLNGYGSISTITSLPRKHWPLYRNHSYVYDNIVEKFNKGALSASLNPEI